MLGFTLYTWGSIPFEVYPLNVHEVQQVTGTDWARKIAGGAPLRIGGTDERGREGLEFSSSSPIAACWRGRRPGAWP